MMWYPPDKVVLKSLHQQIMGKSNIHLRPVIVSLTCSEETISVINSMEILLEKNSAKRSLLD